MATADLRRETEWPYQYLYEQADNFHVVSCATRKRDGKADNCFFIDESGEENIQLARTPVAERVHSPIIQLMMSFSLSLLFLIELLIPFHFGN